MQGTTQNDPVQTKQIAVTAMNMLGLSADSLQGVVLEGTKGLPGLHVPQDQTVTLTVNQNDQVMVGAFYDPSTTDNLNKYKVTVQWGDDLGDRNAILVRDAPTRTSSTSGTATRMTRRASTTGPSRSPRSQGP